MTPPPDTPIASVVKRYAEAWAANDLAAIIDCYHEEVVFHYFGRSPLAGTHRGKPACLAVLKQVRERTNRRLVSIVDAMAGERFGVILATERFEREGRTVTLDRLFRYRVYGGKLAECWVYDDDQRLVDEFWA